MKNWMWFGVVGLVVLGVAAVVAGGTDSGEGADSTAYGTVAVVGEALPQYTDGADAAVGRTAPSVQGDTYTITPGQGPTVIAFLAHWCGFCRNEVPVIQDVVDTGLVPENVTLVAVATSTRSNEANFPPSAWFEREGWTSPLIYDDQNSSAGKAYGVTQFPFWVVLDSNGTVVGRLAGAIGEDGVTQLLRIASES